MRIGVVASELSKIGHHFSNNVIYKLTLSKNVINEKCAPKMKIKLRKFRMIFDIEMDFDSQILALFDASPLHQFSKFNNYL